MRIASLPTIQTFQLKTDPEGTAEVDIRQVTFEDERLRDELFKTRRTLVDDRGMAIGFEQDINLREIGLKEIYLTIAGARNFQDDDGKEIFSFRDNRRPTSEAQFRQALGKLSDEMVSEIHEKVLVVNPQWKTQGN